MNNTCADNAWVEIEVLAQIMVEQKTKPKQKNQKIMRHDYRAIRGKIGLHLKACREWSGDICPPTSMLSPVQPSKEGEWGKRPPMLPDIASNPVWSLLVFACLLPVDFCKMQADE